MLNKKAPFISAMMLLMLFACSDKQQEKNEIWQNCYNHYRAESYLVASETCKLAADLGLARAQWFLGHIHYYDLTEQMSTREQAFSYYLKAAEGGWPEAQTFVGESYMYGDGVAENFEKAFYWLNRAAEFQDSNAEFAIGMLFYNGNGREKDISSAIVWFKKAADKQHLMSINNLAWIHATSQHQAFRDADKALFWVKNLDQSLASIGQAAAQAIVKEESIFLDTKAAALALSNNFEAAIKLQNQAISLLPEDVEESRLLEFQKHLEAYQNNRAWLENDE